MPIFGSKDDDDREIDKEECEVEYREEEVVLEFTRKTVEFTLVRGGSYTCTFDVWQDYVRQSECGIAIRKRGEIQVEHFHRIQSDGAVGYCEGLGIDPETELAGEVTSANVAARDVKEEWEAALVTVVDRKCYVHPETGEVVTRSRLPKHDDDREFTITRASNL